MKEIQLRALEIGDGSEPRVAPVDALQDTDTERIPKEIPVNSPDLLMHRPGRSALPLE